MPEMQLLRVVGWFGCSGILIRLVCHTAVRFVTNYLYYNADLDRYLKLQDAKDKEQFLRQLQDVPHGEIAYGVMHSIEVPIDEEVGKVVDMQVQRAIQRLAEKGYVKISGNLNGCVYIQPTWKGRWQWIKRNLFRTKWYV